MKSAVILFALIIIVQNCDVGRKIIIIMDSDVSVSGDNNLGLPNTWLQQKNFVKTLVQWTNLGSYVGSNDSVSVINYGTTASISALFNDSSTQNKQDFNEFIDNLQ
jgi:hypothetical protein